MATPSPHVSSLAMTSPCFTLCFTSVCVFACASRRCHGHEICSIWIALFPFAVWHCWSLHCSQWRWTCYLLICKTAVLVVAIIVTWGLVSVDTKHRQSPKPPRCHRECQRCPGANVSWGEHISERRPGILWYFLSNSPLLIVVDSLE